MAHKKEFISTGGGFSVLNDGVKTEVISQDGSIVASANYLDNSVLSLGTTTTTAATKISLEFDKTTTGIGQIIMGSTSVPQVLNANPGAAVVGQQINLLHSAGAGDCDDLYGSYTKVAITGDGDSGTTLVGSAPRAYVGTAGGTTVAQEVYGTQPWVKHSGTGACVAMSGVSAALILNDAEAFTATNSINAGHFHVKTTDGAANGTVTSNNFDGLFVEIYDNVTGLDSMLHLTQNGTETITSAIKIGGADYTNVLEFSGAGDGVVISGGTYTSADGYLVIKVGDNTYRVPFFAGTDEAG